MTTAANPLAHLSAELDELKAAHLYRPLRVMSTANGTRVTVDGREVISLASNNYLGLNTHPRLVEAAADAARRFGAGSGAVRTISGTMSLHEELEAALADLQACRGRAHLPVRLHLQHRGDPGRGRRAGPHRLGPAQPRLDHRRDAPGKAPRVIYRHKDVAHLRELLAAARRDGRPDGQPYRAILVVTDGVFSMDGDIAPLPAIVAAAEEHDAAVFVDDAHASGVLGRNGRGTVDHFDLHGRVAIQVGTLSKAMGVLGGYVAGPLALREMLIQRGRPFLFSTSHPPAVAAACLAAIRVLEEEPELIERLWANTRRFKEGLASLGFDTGVSETPITPVMVGDSALAIRFADRLLEEGVWATSVVFPTVALDGARLRTIVTAAHTDDELDACLGAFGRVGRELGVVAG